MRSAARATATGVRERAEPARRRATPARAAAHPLQRKAGACACGGGCPRCATSGSAQSLTIGAVDDPLEREADRAADLVMAMRDPTPLPAAEADVGGLLQRQPIEEEEEEIQAKPAEGADGLLQRQPLEEEEEEEMLQAKAASGESPATGTAGEAFGARLSDLRGGGQAMTAAERGFFEPRFGQDFSGVRLHTGDAADRLARDVGALAFTVGRDIAFRDGAYRPDEGAGRRLMAHELTHVVQQGEVPDVARCRRRP